MRTIYKSEFIQITAKAPETTILGYILLMVREAIEPIALAIGISLLYSRFESVSTISQTEFSIWHAIYADSEAHPMIYIVLATVLVAWIFYKAWKLKDERIRDRELREINDRQTKLLEEMSETLAIMAKKNRGDTD